METEAERVARVLRDEVDLAPWDPAWAQRFAEEADRLRAALPAGLLGRIEHYGSTAVPGLAAKPIVDLLVEVADAEAARRLLPERLPPPVYDYFWRPESGDDGPRYSWLIRRDGDGRRTHHLHCVPAGHRLWDGLRFRDRLRADPASAAAYAALKRGLAERHRHDRIAYTRGKAAFIAALLAAG